MAYLDKNKFMKKASKTFGSFGVISKAIEGIADKCTAADVVPVVRCKDCEHGQFMPSCSMYLCRCTGGKLRYADDYCNYGERKEQE